MKLTVGIAREDWCEICLHDGGIYSRAFFHFEVEEVADESIVCGTVSASVCPTCLLAETVFWSDVRVEEVKDALS